MTPEPYRLADKAIKQLNRFALRLVDRIKQRLAVLGFDELNVLRQMDAMYAEMDRTVRKKLRELFIARYIEVYCFWLEEQKPEKQKTDDEIEDLAEIHIAGLLDEPNPVLHYEYASEVLRKRDRAKEAVESVPTKAQRQIQMDKHIRYFEQMTAWYTDFVSQDAEIAAYKDLGIKKVQRHEMKDSRVCGVCKAADGEIYDVDKIPEIPHPSCRRWFTPITSK